VVLQGELIQQIGSRALRLQATPIKAIFYAVLNSAMA